ncbi:hypothetical protein HU200_042570 [Digitaria exilis]|uniref:Uncharacterized protein n=1 Tax=Digitaria exilis TaxID=1010633 RepID=A0A835BAE5_9POAL|nr:hypothetical protein HU200_042570 [Digitaria exilis]
MRARHLLHRRLRPPAACSLPCLAPTTRPSTPRASCTSLSPTASTTVDAAAQARGAPVGGVHHLAGAQALPAARPAVPQWTDQPTVAWLVEERMGAGVRARVDGEGVVERGELRRCVEAVMGDGEVAATAVRAQSDRWRELAREAVAPGGTSERNLWAFASAAAVRGNA